MKDYTLTEQFALVGLNGQDSRHNTAAKKIVIRGIAVAKFLEKLLEKNTSDEGKEFFEYLDREIQKNSKCNKMEREKIEQEISRYLMAEGVLTEVPDLLGCDMNYDTSGVSMWVYKSAESEYQRITESVRATVLEEGEMDIETIFLLYLFRECACIHDIFSVKEQELVQAKLLSCMSKDAFCKALLSTEFHRIENLYKGFLKRKQEIFKNPYLQGVNLMFPFLERRQAIFIDFVVLGTSVSDRREAAMDFIRKKGHTVEAVPFGQEHLLKIDNCYYRVFPTVRSCRIPVQGVSIVPYYSCS